MKLVVISALASLYMSGAIDNPPPAGSYAVSSGSYELGGFVCGKQEPTCKIWYPTQLAKGPFPVITFGHGVGGSILEDLVASVASLGFVVVAPATSGGGCDESDDMLHAILGSKAKPSLHTALGHVDWSRAGILGHSMGGAGAIIATPKALSQSDKYNVKAVIISHPFKEDASNITSQITIPAMFVTGTEDHRGNVGKDFEACPGRPKILAQVEGAKHMEPLSPGRLNPFDAHFLGCHVAGLKASCTKVYGKGADDMCQANSMTQCQIVQAEEVIV